MARLPLVVMVSVLIVYTLLGHRYVNHWRSDRALWRYAAAVTPLNPVPVVNQMIVSRR